jgi:hypothetical protein
MTKSKRHLIYTVIFRDDYKFLLKKYDLICFTDNFELKSKYFKTIICSLIDNDAVITNRYYKIKQCNILRQYETTLYIDGNIQLEVGNILDYLDIFTKEVDILTYRHNYRNCVYQEANTVVDLGLVEKDIASKQMLKYFNENYPVDNGLANCNLIYRKQGNVINKFNDFWFEEFLNGAKRDQLSFNYVVWKFGVNVVHRYLPGNYDCNFFSRKFEHKKTALLKTELNNEKFHDCLESLRVSDVVNLLFENKLKYNYIEFSDSSLNSDTMKRIVADKKIVLRTYLSDYLKEIISENKLVVFSLVNYTNVKDSLRVFYTIKRLLMDDSVILWKVDKRSNANRADALIKWIFFKLSMTKFKLVIKNKKEKIYIIFNLKNYINNNLKNLLIKNKAYYIFNRRIDFFNFAKIILVK